MSSPLDHSSQRLGRRPALDGLRAIAALLVVATHTAAFLIPSTRFTLLLMPGGGLGVDFFFVLSGFLITTLMLEEHQNGSKIMLLNFYARRGLRLLPAMLAVLVVWCTWAYVVDRRPAGAIGKTFASVLTYTQDYYDNGSRGVIPGLGHLWTLAVEEQFYFIWPLALVFLIRRRLRSRQVVTGLLCVVLLVMLNRTVELLFQPVDHVIFRFDAHSDGLFLGAALSLAWRTGRCGPEYLRKIGLVSFVGYLSLCLLAPGTFFEGFKAGPVWTVAAVLSALSIIASLKTSSAFAGALAAQPLRYVGTISYGIYLWHVPVLSVLAENVTEPTWLKVLLVLPLTILLAALSHRFLETPLLRYRSEFRPAGHEITAATAADTSARR